MGRFSDFVTVWFTVLVVVNFLLLPAIGSPLGIYLGTVVATLVGLMVAGGVVYGRNHSLPGASLTE